MKKEWIHPFWENSTKDRVTSRLNITTDDGTFTTSVATVSKYDNDGVVNPDFEEILQQHSVSAVDANTEERLDRHKKRRESEIARQKERNETKRLEDLFNYKLQTFEIPEIKESTNRKMKAKIRKSRNMTEMNAYATILLMEALNEQEAGESQ